MKSVAFSKEKPLYGGNTPPHLSKNLPKNYKKNTSLLQLLDIRNMGIRNLRANQYGNQAREAQKDTVNNSN